MAEYGSVPIVSKKIAERTPPLVIFGITFGESSFLDYDPDRKLKVNQVNNLSDIKNLTND